MQTEPTTFVELLAATKTSKLNRYNEEEKSRHYEEWKKSGLSMNEYSKRAGIAVSSLSTWVNRVKQPSDSRASTQALSANSSAPVIEIVLPSGLKLRVSKISIAEVLSLVKGLE